ncbi:MAG TPA: FtsX-like permease family protein [Planctomycetes bacterium]|nr:FtsX-like permease family protein [Planctomycetota bacterium]
MKLPSIVARHLSYRLPANLLLAFSILLGTALVTFLWIAADQAERRYHSSSKGYGVVLGPGDTSPLDLVLNTVFHLGQSQGIIPLSVYEQAHADRLGRRVGVRYAIPQVVGDSYRGFPIIGTTDEWFSKFSLGKNKKGERVPLQFLQGGAWRFSHEDLLEEAREQAGESGSERPGGHGEEHEAIPASWREVVLGSSAAERTGLRIGDEVIPSHGVGATLEEHAEAPFQVVGILAPTGTPIDRALYLPIGAFFRLKGHEVVKKGEGASKVAISSVIVDTKHPLGPMILRSLFQRRPEAQAAIPAVEIRKLFEMVGDLALALRSIGFLVLVVAAIGIFNSLYLTMDERRREVAIMRSLGARRSQIFAIVLFEALAVGGTGAFLGILGAHGGVFLFGETLRSWTGVPFSAVDFGLRDLWLLIGVTLLAGLAGLLPGLLTLRTDVARYLSPDR